MQTVIESHEKTVAIKNNVARVSELDINTHIHTRRVCSSVVSVLIGFEEYVEAYGAEEMHSK